MDSDAMLDGLNQQQLAAVTSSRGPVVVLAGAGSGKTRVLTRRIAWRVARAEIDPGRILALTFTRKAATELRARIGALGLRDGVNAGTFHGLALLQLRQRWAERAIDPPVLLDRKYRLVSPLIRSGRGRRVEVGDVVAEIDWARARRIEPADYDRAARAAGRTPPLAEGDMAAVLDGYRAEKRRRRVVDFDDLLELAIRDLEADHGYAEAVRWRYRHLFVDEFQDVNPLQYELLSRWRGDRDDLFVVGDPNQAIYGWNGADPELLDRFVEREPGTTVIRLEENYRSTPQILGLADGLRADGHLRANRSDGPVPTITAYPDDEAEAAGIADRVRQAYSVAGAWGDQAVLVRTNAQLVGIERALTEANIPTRLRGSGGPLASPEVRTELQVLSQPDTDLRASLTDLDQRVAEPIAGASVPQIERRANLAAFVRLVHDYVDTDPMPSGPGLAAWIGTLSAGDVDAERDAVELVTFHAAKGLEWPVVHLAGLEDGFVPIAYAETGAQRNEERRLLYVAVTRARDELHLSWAAQRTFTTRPVTRQPSPHLAALADGIDRIGVGPAHRVDWRGQLARSRRALADTGHGPPGAAGSSQRRVHDALRAWRGRRARAADVPPHVVFSDQTLRAISIAQPTTIARLATMPGVGPAKLSRYGDEVLELVAETSLPPTEGNGDQAGR